MTYPKSAYIHIPFCSAKCFYCAFTSTCNTKLETGYIISLLKDIDTNYEKNKLETLYIGGGTPSLLPLSHIQKILNKFNFSENCEITFELNPENANFEYIKGLQALGINRLSIGIQTFNDDILASIGRKHNASEAINAVKTAKNAGFKNISVDLIYGLPKQTIKQFGKDLTMAKELDVQHISLYGLKIEDNSVFGKKLPENLPDDDIQADMYLKATNELKDFTHYEISNFARSEEYKSKHNLTYWENNEYYGFGCSAHGYENGIRYANSFDIHKYIENPLMKDFGHTETEKEKLEEEIFLGLRLTDGLNTNDINKKYGIDFDKKYKNILNKYIQSGHIEKISNGYKLTINGFLISTIILAEFLE